MTAYPTYRTRQGGLVLKKLTKEVARVVFISGGTCSNVKTVQEWRRRYAVITGGAYNPWTVARAVRRWLDENQDTCCAYVLHYDDSVTRFVVDARGVLRRSHSKITKGPAHDAD